MPEGINVHLRHNKIKYIDLNYLHNAALKSSQAEQSTKLKDITLQLGENPIQCDCRLIEFVRFIKGNAIEELQKNLKFSVDDLYCARPDYMANKTFESLDPKDIRCR